MEFSARHTKSDLKFCYFQYSNNILIEISGNMKITASKVLVSLVFLLNIYFIIKQKFCINYGTHIIYKTTEYKIYMLSSLCLYQ